MTHSFLRFLPLLSTISLLLFAGNVVAQGVVDGESAETIFVPPSPAVKAILSLPQETPKEKFAAVVTLMDLGEAEIALPILQSLAAMEITDQQRAELVREFGSHRMLQLSQDPVLAQAGADFAERCMAAVAAQSRDTARLQKLVEQLNSPEAAVSRAAVVDLMDAGEVGVVYLVETLANSADAETRTNVAAALAAMAPAANRPLLAGTSSQNEQFAADCIRVLTSIGEPKVLALALTPSAVAEPGSPLQQAAQNALIRFGSEVGSLEAAQQKLLHEVNRYRRGVLPFAPDSDGLVEVWFWDDENNRLTVDRFTTKEASTLWAARLAEDAFRLAPDSFETRQLCLVLGLEAAKLRQGYSAPVGQLLLNPVLQDALEQDLTDTKALNGLLDLALRGDYPGAAIAVSHALSAVGDEQALNTVAGKESPLATALWSPHRRVRFAALQAILKIDPQFPFAGSSRVSGQLAQFACQVGRPSVLVAMPSVDKAATLAGMFNGLGYSTDVAASGRELVHSLRQTTNPDFVCIGWTILSPGVRDLVYSLNNLPETRGLPIVLLAPAGSELAAADLADQYDLVTWISQPHQAAALDGLVERVRNLQGRDYVPTEIRHQEAAFAISYINYLLAQPHSIYDLEMPTVALASLLKQPETAAEALGALAKIGTPFSQSALLDYASRLSVPMDSREAAAAAFGQNVREHGVLLTSDQILHQYDRYNASLETDPRSVQVLGSLLDTLESKRTERPGS